MIEKNMNARRKFKLQKVLDLRRLVEKNRQKELASAQYHLNVEQQVLMNLESRRDDFAHDMNKMTRTEVSQFRGKQAYLETLNERISDQFEVISQAQRDVEAKRQQLLEATKEKKALERLKEIKMSEIMDEEKRLEQAFIDEIAIQKARCSTRAGELR